MLFPIVSLRTCEGKNFRIEKRNNLKKKNSNQGEKKRKEKTYMEEKRQAKVNARRNKTQAMEAVSKYLFGQAAEKMDLKANSNSENPNQTGQDIRCSHIQYMELAENTRLIVKTLACITKTRLYKLTPLNPTFI